MEVLAFDEVWVKRDARLGSRVRVSGQFFSNEIAYIAQDRDSCIAGRRMRLLDDLRIEKYLLQVLPVWGGGRFIFNELVTVTGTVQRSGSEYELADLADCVVTCSDGEPTISVPLQRRASRRNFLLRFQAENAARCAPDARFAQRPQGNGNARERSARAR
jgi:hypothetical protein